jgi:hypothetical protein
MPDELRRNKRRARAESLVAAAATEAQADGGRPVSPIARETVTEAVTQDLRAASDSANVDEARMTKLEAQTRVLAEAVIAVSHPTERSLNAIKAVKDEM